MAKTKIEWTHKSWNPITGCTKVSPGCKHCYAETQSKRKMGVFAKKYKRSFNDVAFHPERLNVPAGWTKSQLIFVNSMSDLFHESLSFEIIAKIWSVMIQCPWHIFQVLTKRPARAYEFYGWYETIQGRKFEQNNIWLGVSVENQETAIDRIKTLVRIPASLKWLSVEPLIGPINFMYRDFNDCNGNTILNNIGWIVVGGESGHYARPMHPDWVTSIYWICKNLNIPLFFKQWGQWRPGNEPYRKTYCHIDNTGHKRIDGPRAVKMIKGSKSTNGNEIDGNEYHEFPDIVYDHFEKYGYKFKGK